MRILYLYKALALWGGIERILADKMNYLCEQYGYDITIVTTCQGNHPVPYPLSPKVKHIDLDIRFHTKYQYSRLKRMWVGCRMNRKFVKLLKEQVHALHPDVIVVTTDLYMDTVTRLFKNIPIVAESHSTKHFLPLEFGATDFIRKHIRQKYMQSACKVTTLVTLTEGDAQEWEMPQKTVVIPNFINPNQTERYSSCENKKIIFVGRFAKQKGLESLLEIGKYVFKKHPDWQLHLYGEGELKEEFIGKVQNEHLSENIIIHDPTSHIYEAYTDSSIHISTSRYEPFGLVLCEAMACGIPNIAFDCPYGPKDIIKENEDGFLIENGNTDRFIEQLDYLIEHKEERKRMGKAARENVKRFYPEQIMPKWKQLFENEINKQ